MILDNNTLNRIIASLQIRFPVAELSRELNYSKSAISNYINGVKPISETFIDALEGRYKINVNDFKEGKVLSKFPSLKLDNTKEIAIFIAENKDELMKDPLFKTVIESLFLSSEIKSLKEKL